jgi:hypothetical protein
LEIHHLIHWEDGGRTDAGNLAALCKAHHQHTITGSSITGDPYSGLGFTNADGTPLCARRRRPVQHRHRRWSTRPCAVGDPPPTASGPRANACNMVDHPSQPSTGQAAGPLPILGGIEPLGRRRHPQWH